MTRKNATLLLLMFLANLLHAQVTMDTSLTFTEAFDSIIQNDTTYKVDIGDIQDFEQSPNTKEILEYDKNERYSYHFFTTVFCSNTIEENSKLDFVQEALADPERDIFKSFYRIQCPCLDAQTQLRDLLSNHFKAMATKKGEDYEPFLYMEFAAKNEFPGYLNIIEDYFASRDTLSHLYFNETELPLYLIRAGQDERALELMEMFVEDQKNGKVAHLNDGGHDKKENIFTLLAFSDNPKISQKAIDLAFEFYHNDLRGYTSSLAQFLEYHDLDRYKKALEFWLKEYPKLDSNEYVVNSGFRNLLAGDGLMVAEYQGYQYWELFVNNLKRWEKYNQTIDGPMFDIAIACMKGTREASEKQAIIDFVRKHNRFVIDDSESQSTSQIKKFMKLLQIAKPGISKAEIGSMIPARYKNWEYAYGQLDDQYYYQTDRPSFSSRVEIFQKYGYAQNLKMDGYDKFLFHLGRLNVYRLLETTENLIWFDTEGGMFPLSHADLFKDEFQPVLRKNGIDFLSVNEVHEITDNICHYTINVSNSDKNYQVEFKNGSDWYEVIPYVKALNVALKDQGSDLRLIYIDSQDQTTLIGLFNPNEFLPMAKELNLECNALHFGDGLLESGY